ncbi:hypothetical protein [Brevibacillus borstelensis]|uniref:hypothetical protein n=1 Tax=Brevibacillus borstelensis TaxID=45462 RepID=UPI0011426015|nr:hypothetical protein [Brevibacillus borstelensis]MCC0565834.1 hypothetical protein [Brevibacillus borstelensis]MCM3472094.1 hypothetical protein [Brevibacillus borstelensis]MCM3560709.1 hypothetical protein [Brevibacillus borstelensis]MCM3593050.1 hypothetical protein [Brevibacillus borstelensis]MCM3624404.1 hypothetical protein [Brevibacillus borstelensis]
MEESRRMSSKSETRGDAPRSYAPDSRSKPEPHDAVPGEKGIGKSFLLATILIAAAVFFTGGQLPEGDAAQIVNSRVSTSVAAGEQLFAEENTAGLEAKDFVVESPADEAGEATMLIWDFNAEDGDQIEILVNGKSVYPVLTLTNQPAAISVPVPSVVTVKGLKDAGGGISYAVKLPQSGLAYFNAVSVQGVNTYTINLKN